MMTAAEAARHQIFPLISNSSAPFVGYSITGDSFRQRFFASFA
jgi:hypothetical protein